MAIKTQHITRMYDRLDKIAEERYGEANTETVLFIIANNPGIDAHPIHLPLGLLIQLPDIPQEEKGVRVVNQISLWD